MQLLLTVSWAIRTQRTPWTVSLHLYSSDKPGKVEGPSRVCDWDDRVPGGNERKKFSWTRSWISHPGKSMISNLSGLFLIFLDCLLPPWTDQPECWDTKEKCMHIAHQSNSTKMKACHDFSCSAMRECKTWCFCCQAFTCFIDHLLKLWKCKKTTQQWTLES